MLKVNDVVHVMSAWSHVPTLPKGTHTVAEVEADPLGQCIQLQGIPNMYFSAHVFELVKKYQFNVGDLVTHETITGSAVIGSVDRDKGRYYLKGFAEFFESTGMSLVPEAPEPEVTKPTPHVHAELIKAWADDPMLVIQGMRRDGNWETVRTPYWDTGDKYRIKPEPKDTTKITDRIKFLESVLATQDKDIQDAEQVIQDLLKQGKLILQEIQELEKQL